LFLLKIIHSVSFWNENVKSKEKKVPCRNNKKEKGAMQKNMQKNTILTIGTIGGTGTCRKSTPYKLCDGDALNN
jgi:hypothetical protein